MGGGIKGVSQLRGRNKAKRFRILEILTAVKLKEQKFNIQEIH